ncbi:DUF4159 domain-containing protein [Kaistia dalseonensis]|uniref:DUF4159 domain-containing protein n=1 Tax=Kaistia dalseonensis TaxID=410840 RepID=A0ABU0H665_9HYPH|nr:DUF4159 domain-containing protein [Kaistia dalseonensis]MCX5495214.1 DUF4159 domain-containing protein [Kaistia dalseonensis]MDQ0437799.1 hypothetical protein [Kaistia dalseonensis]
MIGGLPLAFATPLVLSALVLLPAIWWLLKLTPPRPRVESFPPTRILAEIRQQEEQPARSPWWLTLLRLLLAAFVILALAGPVWRPVGESAPGSGPLLLVIDNDWPAARDWPARIDTASRVIAQAEAAGRPISLLATAEPSNQELAPTDAGTVRTRLDALVPRPYAANRAALVPALRQATASTTFGGVTWLASGLGGQDVETFSRFLSDGINAPITLYSGEKTTLQGLAAPSATSDALTLAVLRSDGTGAASGTVEARDMKGRSIGTAPFAFQPGETKAEAVFSLPSELRNEIVRVEISGSTTAGAVQLLDDRFKRRRIGLISGAANDNNAQPLLSPLYYISRAVQPFADVIEPRDANAALAVPQMIEGGAAVIAMADIGTLTPDVEEKLTNWVDAGGTLVRFAGPRLAAATANADTLIPVRLRQGGRVLGGSLSWSSPQPLAAFSEQSPFAGLTVPSDVTVSRQVLAEPDGNLPARTWATLADGTPLVTATRLGKGWLVLFHVTADTSWSNLPLSGSFVEMLRRITAFSSAPVTADAASGSTSSAGTALPPYRLLDGFGRFVTGDPMARPLGANAQVIAPDRDHPPGLYGAEDGFRAVNVLAPDALLLPLDPTLLKGATLKPYPTSAPTDLSPYLLLAALACLLADALAVLWLHGGLRIRRAAPAAFILAALLAGALPRPVHADAASDQFAVDAVSQTRLAYVTTGDSSIDDVSRAGLAGLSRELANRTALEPGDPVGVDIAKDELAFFPLLYWPIDPNSPMPSSATLARVDAYMKQGGTILFDTRDELDRTPGETGFAGTPAAERLRVMLSGLDIPPLEPVPSNHVLTKAFYLLADFPGRYSGGPLWVEASTPDDDPASADRPARPGDGVSSLLITENDLAAAWATDADGRYLYPTLPPDPRQREYAFRTGINIVMYTLTGNYKADQVHVPALLERLGQ